MWEALERLLSGSFMPHGHCYLWSPGMVWLQVVSNLLIGTAYVAISTTLYLIVRRIKDVPFPWMYLAFGIFIITCGATHFLDVVTIWRPIYWLDGGLRAVTAVASVGTAVLLVGLVPKAVGLAGAAQTAHERGLELERTYEELAVVHEKHNELARLKTEFYANISHELRTPLTLVLGPTERLLRSPTTSEADRRDLELVARNARTLLKHVNDLLDVAKLEAGKMPVDYACVDASELVRHAARHFEGLAGERSIVLTIDAPDMIEADLDADKIERTVLNLLSNAFKFTPGGGTVRCAVRATASRVSIEIADSGPGVDADMRAHVFERFVQAHAGQARRFGGTGLGLSIAKELSELHGGEIRVDTAPEGGAAFLIDLPLRAPDGVTVRSVPVAGAEAIAPTFAAPVATAPAPTTVAPLPLPLDDGAGIMTRATVLLVEDNRDMSELITGALARAYVVERAYDGEEGIIKARALRPDLIVTDMMMPRKDGEELVRAVRLEKELDHVPIVVLTARSDDALRARVLAAGAQDYLTKPFSSTELLARVGNLVAFSRLRTAHQRELEASKLKTDFLGMVSHELRTPLTAIQLLIDRLVDVDSQPLPPRERQIVDRLAAAASRLTDLVDTLLHYARIQSGHVPLDVEPFDLGALAAEATEEVRPQAQRKSLELAVVRTELRVRVDSDPKLVRLVIVNLVSNAVKFTEQGRVTVTVLNAGDRRVLRVADTGPGIASGEQKRIFEPFHQLAPTKHKHLPGVGLGLSLVRQIVDNLEATITVESEIGKGSTFELSLPARHPRARPVA